jgi:putative NADH-flavin reductase
VLRRNEAELNFMEMIMRTPFTKLKKERPEVANKLRVWGWGTLIMSNDNALAITHSNRSRWYQVEVLGRAEDMSASQLNEDRDWTYIEGC